MHQRKGKKILIYFFLLFLVGSINNIEFNNLKFEAIKNINVLGLGQQDNKILFNDIKNLNLDNIFFLNVKKINNLINSNTLVENYEIFKRYPSTLDINIDKTEFLAKINYDQKILLIGSNGKLSKDDVNNNSLPFIFGKPDIQEFLNFKKIVDSSKLSYQKIKSLYFYPSKRWDIELKNDIVIKLSSNFNKDTVNFALDFLQNKNSQNIEFVDVRIKNQIITND
jgi:cell division protein FtsQ